MARTSTLHVKFDPAMAQGLKDLAERRNQPVAELVRQAVVECYQVELLGLTGPQKKALSAYQGGYISLGRLAEVMGRSALDTRAWLTTQGIRQNSVLEDDDTANA